ncbi:MAG: flagellar biosynthesis anti-sigma factor FlgM [Bryobacterales bacterium]|nr:flagellar biosynthesis anti-sigma factor FlgM [Bryobacterales bacterium]
MRVNDPNLSSLAGTGASRTLDTSRAGQSGPNSPGAGTAGASDDVQVSELARSLRSLAGDSPDRQAQIEQIARDYANGSYKVDAAATASKIIDDATQ